MALAAAPPRARGELSGHIALIGVQLCFGLFPYFGKLAFADFSPRAVAAWRMTVAAAVFVAIAIAVHGRQMIPERRDFVRLLICSILGVAANQVLYLEGLERSTSVNSGLMMLLIPVFTFTIAVLVRQESFSMWRGLGIAVACAGTAQLVLQKEADNTQPYLFGNLLIAANTLCYSVYLVMSKPLARRYPPLVLMAWVFLLSVWTTPIYAAGVDLAPADASLSAWIALGLILLFPTVLGYLLNMFALSHVPASTTAVYVFGQPVIAGAAGVIYLGEPLHGSTLVAAAAIFLGIWLVVRPRRE